MIKTVSVEAALTIQKPANFNFQRTVMSHGWYALLPFSLDKENWVLRRVIDLENYLPVLIEIRDAEAALEISLDRAISENDAAKLVRDVRHVLQLDEDFSEFYALVNNESYFAWIAERSAGRLLRSPTVFEDLVKSICTTNCSWALTKIMTTNLVEKLGEPTSDREHKNFPSAEQMATQTIEFYKNEIRAGYRSQYLRELAVKVASGTLDVESWLTSDLPTSELKKEMKRVKGVGDYAAENLLKLLGRYDGLALDSFLRMRFAQLHKNGEKCDDKIIHQHYERFGKWRGLALWCDATKDWL